MILPSKYQESNKIKNFSEPIFAQPTKKEDPHWKTCVTCGVKFYTKGNAKYCIEHKKIY